MFKFLKIFQSIISNFITSIATIPILFEYLCSTFMYKLTGMYFIIKLCLYIYTHTHKNLFIVRIYVTFMT